MKGCFAYGGTFNTCGSLEAFEAAVKAGAYIGGSAFNARQYADNFNDGNLKYALDYSHLRGVKVYITVNKLVRDDKFKAQDMGRA